MLRIFLASLATLFLLTLPASASAADPQDSPAFAKAWEKGRASMEKGKFKAAIKHLKKAEGHAGEPPVQLLLDLAVCFNSVWDSVSAEAYARRAHAATEPVDRVRAVNNIGISLYQQVQASFLPTVTIGRDSDELLEEAESAFREVLEATGGRGIALYSLGEVLKLRGRREEARAAFVEYLESSPEDARAAGARRALDWIDCVGSFMDRDTIGPLLVEGEVEKPVGIHTPQPEYPAVARREGISGTMAFEVIIDDKGDIRCVDVLKGLPLGLSGLAAKTLRQWRFEPATLHGEPVVVKYNLYVTMRIF